MSEKQKQSEGKAIKQASDNKMSEIIRTSIDGIKTFTDMDAAFGSAIHTPSGVTIIPVSKITLGFASGGLDYSGKRSSDNNFGGGGGTAVSITPVGFIAVGKNAEVSMIPIEDSNGSNVERALSLVERSPEIIEKIKNILS